MENKIGTIISTLRKENGLTQKDLARELNISDKAVSRWETGMSSPSVDMLYRISKYFNISFNDLLTARVSTDESDDNIVEDIIEEMSEIKKKNSKKIKTIVISAISIIIILAMTIIFTHSYNRFKVYKINIESEELYYNSGVYIETKIKDTLFLKDIKIREYEYKNTDTISIDLYFVENDKEYIIQSYSSLENIRFDTYQSYIKIDDLSDYIDKLYMRVKIIDSKNKVKEYNGRINFVLDFSNNKIFYNEDKNIIQNRSVNINIDVDEIKLILLDNGFEEIVSGIIQKRDKNYYIRYHMDSNIVNYTYENNNFSFKYTYHLNNKILDVLIYDENTTEIQKYKYDVANDKIIECEVGSCTDYKAAMNMIEKNFLNLIYSE